MPTDTELECEAGIHGGCGACKVCDPEWWEAHNKTRTQCPECGNSLFFPGVTSPYCENCDWPDEDFSEDEEDE